MCKRLLLWSKFPFHSFFRWSCLLLLGMLLSRPLFFPPFTVLIQHHPFLISFFCNSFALLFLFHFTSHCMHCSWTSFPLPLNLYTFISLFLPVLRCPSHVPLCCFYFHFLSSFCLAIVYAVWLCVALLVLCNSLWSDATRQMFKILWDAF